MPSASQNYATNPGPYGQFQGTPTQFQGTPNQYPGQYQGTPSQFQGTQFHGNAQVGAGTFPATPQGTPGMVSPFATYYPGTPYSWMTPYLQGVPLAYYQAYGSPSVNAARATMHSPEDDIETTPTRYDSGTTGRRGGGQGRNQG